MKPYHPHLYQWFIEDEILSKKRVAIWSFMGSGKTAATLSALGILVPVYGPALVIAPPLVAADVWVGETEKWEELSDIRVVPIMGSRSERVRAINTPADVYTTNFEQVQWLVNYFGENWPFKIVVVDEASKLRGFRGSFQRSKLGKVFLRTAGSKRASMLAKRAFSKVERFIELSGTPAPNGLQNLWGQVWFLDGGKRLGNTYSAFEKRWFETGHDGYTLEPKDGATDTITNRVVDVCFSLVASDWFDIEKPIERNVYVTLSPKAWTHYKEMQDEFYTKIRNKEIEAVNAAAKSGKLSQIANGAVYTDETKHYEVVHDEKIKALDHIIEETCGAPLLVVYHYKHDLKELKRAFPKGVVLDKDRATVKKWNAGRIPFLFIHAASCGHGNNLQDGGNIVVFYGIDWDFELYDQVLERIGPVRQIQSGYNRNVYVYHILAKDTIDEVKLARHKTKCSVQTALIRAASGLPISEDNRS